MMGGDDKSTHTIKASNIEIYGESPAPDCPKFPNGTIIRHQCNCIDKFGMMLSHTTFGAKEPYPRGPPKLPIRKIKTDSTWAGKTEFKNLKFINFKTHNLTCGSGFRDQAVFVMNSFGADYIPL